MTQDIVERLRVAQVPYDPEISAQDYWEGLCEEAADTIAALRRSNETWQRNNRETFDAMVAMRNSINEHAPMPSLESDLLHGPENSVFCAVVADAVINTIAALRAEVAELKARALLDDKAMTETATARDKAMTDLRHWRQEVGKLHLRCDLMQASAEAAEAEVAFTATDGQRLLRKADVADTCDSPELCFGHEGRTVRCGPCAALIAARNGVELNQYTASNPQAMKLRRELTAAEAEVARLTAEREIIRNNIPMSYLQRHDAPGATGPTAALDLVSAMRDYAEDRWKAVDLIKAADARADAAFAAGVEAAKELRAIAGMDLIGASAVAWNAARKLEAAIRAFAPAKGGE